MRRIPVFLILFVLLVPGHRAMAAEAILNFASVVKVNPDSSLTVEETIRVRAERRKIRRGIFRDFPVRYQEDGGLYRYVGFKVLDIQRNGQSEPWHREWKNGIVRVYIGDKDRFIQTGVHTYTIRYRTTRQLRYFDEYDEIYWNVTGNFWDFPIENATARIELPDGAEVLQAAGYTGRIGQQGRDFNVFAQSATEAAFETTRRLGWREGLTVAVAFPKGVVSEPGPIAKMLWKLWDNIGFGILFIGVIVAGWYFYTMWKQVGRDPERGTVIPLFRPPEGLSPAAVSYIHFMKFKSAGGGASKPFIAALMSLAQQGWLRIVEEDDDITIERQGRDGGPKASGEAVIYKRLLGSRERFAFEKSNGKKILSARSAFRLAVSREHDGVFFRNNRTQFGIGAVIVAVTLIGFFIVQQPGDSVAGVVIFMALSSALGSFLLSVGLRRLLGWIPGGGSKILGTLAAIAGLVALVPALLLPFAASNGIAVASGIAIAALPAMLISFYHLLRAPTPLGAKVMDEIEGFKLYLSVAEAERMNMAGAPDMSQEVFEEMLPYAVALDVEKPWGEAFESWLARAAPEAQRSSHYRPRWYHGSSWDSGRIGSATAGMVSAVNSGMASAMPSKSGSGGGGFSGGGGGGGGGGGW